MPAAFAPLKNDTMLRALLRQPTDYTPVWMMRQAGRYLPEYKAVRQKAGSIMALARNPQFATEVTLQPVDRFALDAAILFSDILTIPDAMGLGLHFMEGEGPVFERPLRDEAAVLALQVPAMESLQYVFDAVGQIRTALDGRVPLIGFAGSPWTLACYMVEGGSSRDLHAAKTMLYRRPDLMHHILRTNASTVVSYLNAQIDAGAQAVVIFDSLGGALTGDAYQQFSLHYMREVVQQLNLHKDGVRIPCTVYAKGAGMWLEQIAGIGVDAIGVDWTVNLAQARARVGQQVALQGNLDPAVLFADDGQIRAEVAKVLHSFGAPGEGSGHVFNLGHGISQFTDPQRVAAMVDAAHEISRGMRPPA